MSDELVSALRPPMSEPKKADGIFFLSYEWVVAQHKKAEAEWERKRLRKKRKDKAKRKRKGK